MNKMLHTQQLPGFEVGLYLATIGQPLKSCWVWSKGVHQTRSFSCVVVFTVPICRLRCWSMRLAPCTMPKRRSRACRISDQAVTITRIFCRSGRINWTVNIYWTYYPISTTLDCGDKIQLIVVMNCDGIYPIGMQFSWQHCRYEPYAINSWTRNVQEKEGWLRNMADGHILTARLGHGLN